MTGVNVISPTWFSVTDNSGNISSLASGEYVMQAHEKGLKVWGLVDNFNENMNTKEVLEVKIWDEYLMFAYIFGNADKVAKQLKNLYPEVIEQSNFDYDTLIFINNISTTSVSAASAARSAAESYSSGGGGFSSGGGGGGSFGGGGGGGSR